MLHILSVRLLLTTPLTMAKVFGELSKDLWVLASPNLGNQENAFFLHSPMLE